MEFILRNLSQSTSYSGLFRATNKGTNKGPNLIDFNELWKRRVWKNITVFFFVCAYLEI